MEESGIGHSKIEEESVADDSESRIKQTLIDKYREDYKDALLAIDNDVKNLIQQGREMKGLMLLSEKMNTIVEIHEALSNLYLIIFHNTNVLEKFGSERLRQLGHEPKMIFDAVEDTDYDVEIIESAVISGFREIGITKKHWLIKERILVEIEYMLDALQILIEPEFIPLEEKIDDSDNSETIDRYIPPAVKLAVWRRDQGKCVQCGSKDKLEYDHIIPTSKGGSNTERNVQLLCEKCNREKSAKIA